MKKRLLSLLCLAATCGWGAPPEVWCGVEPVAGLVRAIGGEGVVAESLLRGAQDPCVFSPTPRAVARMRQADLFFTAGMPFERAAADRLQAMNPAVRVVDLSKGIDTDGDPHIWMSLTALSSMAERIAQELRLFDPARTAEIERNLKTLQDDLAVRHKRLQAMLEPYRGTLFYVVHPVLGGFARDYGLVQQPVEVDGRSPSPRQLLSLIERARDEGVRLIFVQPQFSDRPARILASRIGGWTVELNPLAADPAPVLEQAAEEIVRAYSPEEN